ncbi:hypothetical protein TNIN_457851 [Trichonephila inaurata madagascariensis]|uniref:Transposase Tc1-like domain-containing protein n=1 Tax=Trichonephila inaurata madagascariensis TaxID=2747483 RepID=A0A8X6X7I6_9ARAC|nr:hypothetical protein TNIN_457851 [Trichonephila inaurata madagascariensis]
MRGNGLNKSRCGRPHKLSDRDARAIVRKVKKNPKISAPKLVDQIATASGKKVHPETVRRIRSGGYNGRGSSRKPFISSVNQQKRLDFASPHVDKEGRSRKKFAHHCLRMRAVDTCLKQHFLNNDDTIRLAREIYTAHAFGRVYSEMQEQLQGIKI